MVSCHPASFVFSMAHILVVCTANICRSPVGAALLKDRLAKRGFADWIVSSAGTWAQWVRGASRFSVEVMARQGIDISGHCARMIDEGLLQQSDLVLCMEIGHVEALQYEFPAFKEKIYLLSEMTGQRFSVPDPYGEPLTQYQAMAEEVAALIDDGLERIIELASRGEQQN